jgi:hypothetical protein
MPSLLSLAAVGVGGFALYRAYQAHEKGVPIGDAFAHPFEPLESLHARSTGQAAGSAVSIVPNVSSAVSQIIAATAPKLFNSPGGVVVGGAPPGYYSR